MTEAAEYLRPDLSPTVRAIRVQRSLRDSLKRLGLPATPSAGRKTANLVTSAPKHAVGSTEAVVVPSSKRFATAVAVDLVRIRYPGIEVESTTLVHGRRAVLKSGRKIRTAIVNESTRAGRGETIVAVTTNMGGEVFVKVSDLGKSRTARERHPRIRLG